MSSCEVQCSFTHRRTSTRLFASMRVKSSSHRSAFVVYKQSERPLRRRSTSTLLSEATVILTLLLTRRTTSNIASNSPLTTVCTVPGSGAKRPSALAAADHCLPDRCAPTACTHRPHSVVKAELHHDDRHCNQYRPAGQEPSGGSPTKWISSWSTTGVLLGTIAYGSRPLSRRHG